MGQLSVVADRAPPISFWGAQAAGLLALAASRRELSKKRIRENRARLLIHASGGVSFSGVHTKCSHRCQRIHMVTPLHDLSALDGNDRDEPVVV